MRSVFSQSIQSLLTQQLAEAARAADGFTAYARQAGHPITIRARLEKGAWFNAYASKRSSWLGALTRPFGLRRFDGDYEIVFYEGTLVRLACFYEVITTIFLRNEKHPDETEGRIFVHDDQNDPSSKRVDIPTVANEPIVAAIFDDYDVNDVDELVRVIEDKLVLFEIGAEPLTEMARSSVEIAVRFLAMHECAHITGGHLDHLEETLQLRALPEFSKGGRDTEAMLQVMEVDADIVAFMNLLVHIGAEKMEQDQLYEVLRQLYFCISSLFGAFDLSMRTAASYNASSHPDPDHRFRVATTYGGAVAGAVNPQFAAAERRALEATVNTVPRVFQELGVMGGGLYLFAASQTDETMRRKFEETCVRLVNDSYAAQSLWRRRVRGETNPFPKRPTTS
jgi:hypothetical protein